MPPLLSTLALSRLPLQSPSPSQSLLITRFLLYLPPHWCIPIEQLNFSWCAQCTLYADMYCTSLQNAEYTAAAAYGFA